MISFTVVSWAKSHNADLSDDALVYAGSATVEDWRNWVPLDVVGQWRALSLGERAIVFRMAQNIARQMRSKKEKK